MMLRALLLAWMLVVLAVPCAIASDGWFGGSSKPAANGVTTGKKSGMSAWLPSWSSSSKPKAKSTKPSKVSSMTKGTKNAWSKTVSFLNPFDGPSKPASSSTNTSANSSSWFGSSKPKEEKPGTMSDWLGGKKPEW